MSVKWSSDRVAAEQDAGIFAFERTLDGKTVLVVINTSDTKTSETSAALSGGGPMVTSFAAGTRLSEVLSGDAAAAASVGAGGTLTVSVPARGAKIFVPMGDVVPVDPS